MEATVTVEGDMFKLTTDNYSYWKPMMEDHLYCKDLHEPIIMKEKPEGKDDKTWEILNRKAVAVIQNTSKQSSSCSTVGKVGVQGWPEHDGALEQFQGDCKSA
uniref:Uncharacterized protein n=1 Tax=Brassica oleracea var. oleracea TaxID=109376 RepID=A0A0D3CFK1_BRAOL